MTPTATRHPRYHPGTDGDTEALNIAIEQVYPGGVLSRATHGPERGVTAMTGDQPDTDEVRNMLQSIQAEAGEAREELDRGPNPAELNRALDTIERNATEMERMARAVEEAAETLTGKHGDTGVSEMDTGMENAWAAVDTIADLAASAEDALDADEGVTGTLTIADTEFEVTLERVDGGTAEYDPGYPFGEWLTERMGEADLTRNDITEMSLASTDDVRDILDHKERPDPEVGESIVKALSEEGHITAASRRSVLLDFGWTDSDVGVDEDDIEEYHSPNHLADLFG